MEENRPNYERKSSKLWKKILQIIEENPRNYGRKSSKLWEKIVQIVYDNPPKLEYDRQFSLLNFMTYSVS